MWRLPALHDMPSNVQGRTIIVTGPTRCASHTLHQCPTSSHTRSGIGRETAAYFACKGAHGTRFCNGWCTLWHPPTVVLACRDLRRGDALKDTLEHKAAACNAQPTIEVGHQGATYTYTTFYTHVSGLAVGRRFPRVCVALFGRVEPAQRARPRPHQQRRRLSHDRRPQRNPRRL